MLFHKASVKYFSDVIGGFLLLKTERETFLDPNFPHWLNPHSASALKNKRKFLMCCGYSECFGISIGNNVCVQLAMALSSKTLDHIEHNSTGLDSSFLNLEAAANKTISPWGLDLQTLHYSKSVLGFFSTLALKVSLGIYSLPWKLQLIQKKKTKIPTEANLLVPEFCYFWYFVKDRLMGRKKK